MTTSAWIDGRPASAEALRALALVNYGHFTTLQVRAGAAQGLDLHLRRLCEATRELFGHDFDVESLRAQLRRALEASGTADCTLRATVFAPGFDPLRGGGEGVEPQLLVSVSAPLAPPGDPLRVRSIHYLRAAPHIKHLGTFALFHHRRLAVAEGYDDALFVDVRGAVLEGSVWNLGFLDGDGVVWPQGPALRGITERLLQDGLAAAGVAQETRVVTMDELAGFRAAFACNARGVRAIGGIDAVDYPVAPDIARLPADALSRQPWQAI